MPDIYVNVGPMSTVSDTNKVALQYAQNARKLMRDTAVSAIEKTPGFTTGLPETTQGFHFNATLNEISFGTHQGRPSVTCKVEAELSRHPRHQLLAGGIRGKATLVGGTSDRDVAQCIKETVKGLVEDTILPAIKETNSKP